MPFYCLGELEPDGGRSLDDCRRKKERVKVPALGEQSGYPGVNQTERKGVFIMCRVDKLRGFHVKWELRIDWCGGSGKGVCVEEKRTVFFQTRVREERGIPVVELEGEVDLSTSPQFKETVYQLIDSGKRDIVVDLDGLDFMDSTGLGVLVAVLKRTSMEGGRIRLVCSKRSIMKVFSITGLDKVFAIYDNLQRCLDD